MRIPLGPQGGAIAELPRTPTPRGGSPVGQALQQLGGQVQGAVLDERQRQRQDEDAALRQAQLDRREMEREAKQQFKEAEQTRQAADKATAQARSIGVRDSLDDLHTEFDEGIQTGRIDKTKAGEEWRKRSAAVVAEGVKGVPEAHLAFVQNDLNSRALRLENKVGASVRKRDQTDTMAGIDQTLEYAQRLSVTEPDNARKIAADTLDQLGPFAGMDAATIGKRKQTWGEGVSYTRAYTAIMTVKDNNGQLKAADKAIASDAQMDPQKKIQLLTTSAGFQAANAQRVEAAAARAQRQQEAHLKRAEAEFNVFRSIADKGGALDPAYVATLAAKTAGTPYASGIKELAEQSVATGGLAVQPLSVQRASLQAIDAQIAKTGRNAALDTRRSQVEKVLRASEADAKKDGLQAYVERGGGTADKIDASSPTALAGSLAGRIEYAQRASQWAQQPVSPLFDHEADGVRDMLSKLPDRERSQAVQALANALPPTQAAALAKQMDPKDEVLGLMFANAAPISRNQNGSVTYATTSEGRIATELIARGARAMKDGTSTKGEKVPGVRVATWKANIATQVEGAFQAQTVTDGTVKSALYIAHGMASEKGGELSQRDLDLAVGLAVGGSIADLNGRKVPLPAGVDQDALERRLATVTPEELQSQAGGPSVRAGGVEIPVTEFARRLPGAQLMLSSRGKYMVIVQGRPVVGANGKPVLIGVE